MSLRLKRVESVLQREIGKMLNEGVVKDTRIGFVTVIKVEVSPDLRYAKVFISILGDRKDRRKTLQGLKNAKGFIQSEIGHAIKLRYTPEISFIEDQSFYQKAEIDVLIDKIHKEKPYAE
ncbi:30S ribosome-binding factor RbfA [bacterium]|nr:30S ribosome-binding factor RbfA [bacterium]